MLSWNHEFVEVGLAVERTHHRQPDVADAHSAQIQLLECLEVLGGIDELLLVLGLEDGQVLLSRSVHVSLLIEGDIRQFLLSDQTLRNGLAHDLVNDFVQSVHFYIENTRVVGVNLDGENTHAPHGHLRLPQLTRPQDLLPFGNVVVGAQSKHHYGRVECFNRHQTIEVVGIDLGLNDVLESFPAGIHKRNVNEVRVSFLPQGRPEPAAHHLHRLHNFLLSFFSLSRPF